MMLRHSLMHLGAPYHHIAGGGYINPERRQGCCEWSWQTILLNKCFSLSTKAPLRIVSAYGTLAVKEGVLVHSRI